MSVIDQTGEGPRLQQAPPEHPHPLAGAQFARRLARTWGLDRTGPLIMSAGSLLVASTTQADVVSLTAPNASGTINGAVFSTATPHTAGAVDSFLRTSRSGAGGGYNTSVPSHMLGRDEVAGSFTHDLTLGDVGRITVGGVEYFQFFLDVNGPTEESGGLLSIEDVRIYTSRTAHTAYVMSTADLGTLRYGMDLGGDNGVEFAFGGEAGAGNMAMLVPSSLFVGDEPGSFVYLYSHFGASPLAPNEFEEWLTRHPTLIPLPASVWAAFCGLAGLGGYGVLRRRSLAGSI